MSTEHKKLNKAREQSIDKNEYEKLAASLVDDFERRLRANEDPPPDAAAYLRRFRGPQETRKNLRVQLNLSVLMIVGAQKGVIDWDHLMAEDGIGQGQCCQQDSEHGTQIRTRKQQPDRQECDANGGPYTPPMDGLVPG